MKKIILNKNKFKKSLNEDINHALELTNNSRDVLVSDYMKIINQYEIFDKERNDCQKYRLTLTPNIIASNVLAQPITEIYDINNNLVTGDTRFNLLQTLTSGYTYNFGYDIFDNHYLRLNTFKTGNTITDYDVFTLSNILSIQDSVDSNLIDDNGWVCFYNRTKINNKKMLSWKQPNEKIDLFPTRNYFSLKPFVDEQNNLNYNWDYTITYPYKNEKGNLLVTNVNGINGLPIFRAETGFTNENGNYLEIQTPYRHGLNNGDIVRLKDSLYQTGKTYQIYSVGDINGENKSSVFLLDIDKYSDLKNTMYINNIKNRRIVKYTNGIESEYYIRIFKKLEEEPVSDVYKLGFAKNIYSDDIHQIQYIDDINIGGLVDNLDRPLSELYITFLKRNNKSDIDGHNNVFGDLTSGINELPAVTGYTNVRILNSNNTGETYLENNITISGSSYGNNMFIGDIVEFNKYQVKEYVLDDIMYRFNLISREKVNGLYYHEFVSEINVNLLKNSSNFSNLNNWFTAGETPYGVAEISINEGIKCIKMVRTAGTGYVYVGQDLQLKPDTIYTYSFMCKNNSVGSIYFYDAGVINVQYAELPVSSTFKLIKGSFLTSNTSLGKSFRIDCNGLGVLNSEMYLYDLKFEEGNINTAWTPSLTEASDILLVKNKITVGLKNEGYFYKPHYKIPIKNYSNIKKQGELTKIYPCNSEPFISGVTNNGVLVQLDTYSDNDISYLLLKIDNSSNFTDYDRIRISKLNVNGEIIENKTFNLRIFSDFVNNIAIPYDELFFGVLNNVNNNIYLFNSYYSPEIPTNSISISEDKVFWRDMQTEGVFDENSTFTEENIFTNNSLYVNRNLNLYLRRQDPFGYYGVKDRAFPSDLFGNEKIDYLNNNRYEKNNGIC